MRTLRGGDGCACRFCAVCLCVCVCVYNVCVCVCVVGGRVAVRAGSGECGGKWRDSGSGVCRL